MPHIDQFESVFKAADKPPFVRDSIEIKKVLVITDLNDEAADQHCATVQHLLGSLNQGASAEYQVITGDQFTTVA
ncbi:MAG: hypothetical protein VX644_04990, partial [Planctomycetota bacterium]|nr:hypothetical protein [Planctomycetota bacterium]